MASRERVNRERDPRPVILALEAQNSTSCRQPARCGRARVPKSCTSSEASRFVPGIINVHTGENILERIKKYFECQELRPNFQSSSLNAHVLSAHGEVSNPTLLRQGSPMVFEGLYAIGSFLGRYNIPHNGPVELDNMKIVFYGSHGQCYSGDVTDSLIAATSVQVVVSWMGYVDEHTVLDPL